MDMIFIHTENKEIFEELKKIGFKSLKETSPFVLLFDEDINFNFDDKEVKINDNMYF